METLSEGWLRSGDLGVMHQGGYMEVKDRLKDIIISGREYLICELDLCYIATLPLPWQLSSRARMRNGARSLVPLLN